MSGETFEQVTRDFAVSFAEPRADQPTDLVLEQWTAGADEPPDMATLNRIYLAPKQVPRVALAMLEALRRLPAKGAFAATAKGLQDALEQRKAALGQNPPAGPCAWHSLRPSVVRRMAAMLRERRQAEAAKAAEATMPKAAKGKQRQRKK